MWSTQTIDLIHKACVEDMGGFGDITSALLHEPRDEIEARVVSRGDGVICGLALGPDICEVFSRHLKMNLAIDTAGDEPDRCADGQLISEQQTVAIIRGARVAVLAVERTLLNFLGRMSGVATLTQRYVQAARRTNPDIHVLDTRKTIPGWRELDKYAVRTGGGFNHRMGLYDAILIKDNHIADIPLDMLAATLTAMLKKRPTHADFVEVEVDNLAQFKEVCKVPGVDIVLLDNYSPDEMRAAVEHRDAQGLRGVLKLEASGKVNLDTIAEIAATGVDRISAGALTHSAPTFDLGLDFA